MSRYDDIIHLPHHVSKTRKPMPMINRAAQFAPFAALTGRTADRSEADTVIGRTGDTVQAFGLCH